MTTVLSTSEKKKLWNKAVDLYMQNKLNGADLQRLHDMYYRRRK